MELYLSSVGIRTNQIMKVLTVISSIFIPLTFIVGIYGMNFAPEVDGKKLPWNMPELYQPWGYVAVMLFMLGIAVFQIFISRSGAGSSAQRRLPLCARRRPKALTNQGPSSTVVLNSKTTLKGLVYGN